MEEEEVGGAKEEELEDVGVEEKDDVIEGEGVMVEDLCFSFSLSVFEERLNARSKGRSFFFSDFSVSS